MKKKDIKKIVRKGYADIGKKYSRRETDELLLRRLPDREGE